MPEYVVTSPGGWAGWRVTAPSPRDAAAIAATRDLSRADPPELEQAPAPYPAEWIVIDFNVALFGYATPIEAHRFRRMVK